MKRSVVVLALMAVLCFLPAGYAQGSTLIEMEIEIAGDGDPVLAKASPGSEVSIHLHDSGQSFYFKPFAHGEGASVEVLRGEKDAEPEARHFVERLDLVIDETEAVTVDGTKVAVRLIGVYEADED